MAGEIIWYNCSMERLLTKSIVSQRSGMSKELLYIFVIVVLALILMIVSVFDGNIKVYASDREEAFTISADSTSIEKTDSPSLPLIFKGIIEQNISKLKVQNDTRNFIGPVKIVQIEYPDTDKIEPHIAFSQTVGEILDELQIETEGYKVYPEKESLLLEPYTIQLVEYREDLIVEKQVIKYPKQEIYSKSIVIGKKNTLQKGVNGELTITYLNVYEGRILTSSTEVSREVSIQPQAEIIEIGTKPHKITINGDTFTYCKKMRVWATYYDKDCKGCSGRTSLGVPLRKGVIAVDPNIIPYRTEMYVPGYGYGKALDTGGGILGYKSGYAKIDLGYYDYETDPVKWRTGYTDLYLLCK